MITRTLAIVLSGVLWTVPSLADQTTADNEQPDPAVTTPAESLETILSNPLPRGTYGETRRCISKGKFRKMEVIDISTVTFKGGPVDDYVWVSFLLEPCRGLAPEQVIHLRAIKPMVCAGDSFAGLRRSVTADPRHMFQASENCALGMMHRVERESLDALLHAVNAKRRTRTIAETQSALE